VSGHKPHALRPVGEVALALTLVHEILCGDTGVSRRRPSSPQSP
jgi:hypothetical protein